VHGIFKPPAEAQKVTAGTGSAPTGQEAH